MPAPYSGVLRDQVAAALASGVSARAAASRFGVSVSTAIRWAQRLPVEGHAQARAMGGDHRSRLVEHRAAVLELVAKQRDLTLQEIRGGLPAASGITVGLTSLWHFLKAQKITLKKSLHAAEQDRLDVAAARRVFIRRQPAVDPDRLVFIDETWAATTMARRYGRAGRGLRLLAAVPHRHRKVTTLVAGLRTSGIAAPRVFDGAMNGERFRAYVEQMLAPTLRSQAIVLLDNLSSHKAAGVIEAVTAQGARLVYLPPYSPDLNPIEQAFAKFKVALRKAAKRTRDSLWRLIGQTLHRFQPQECRNFLEKRRLCDLIGRPL